MSEHSRRDFAKAATAVLGTAMLTQQTIHVSGMQSNSPPATKPQIALTLVHDFVANAHGDLVKVTALLEQEPALLNSAWDWGGGDYETAMGAAGHMGRADIAEYLLSKGARMDLFPAAMLGHVEIVKATLAAVPGLRDSKGPHGIPLRAHAEAGMRKGVNGAEAVLAFLDSLK